MTSHENKEYTSVPTEHTAVMLMLFVSSITCISYSVCSRDVIKSLKTRRGHLRGVLFSTWRPENRRRLILPSLFCLHTASH